MKRIHLEMSNSQVDLDFEIGSPGHYRLTDRLTGETYEAPDLGVVTTWDITEDRFRRTLLFPTPNPEDWRDEAGQMEIVRSSDTKATIKVDLGGAGSPGAMGGIRIGVQFSIEIELNENQVELTIPEESFRENRIERYRVFSIELLPCLGATPKGSPGYIFIPTRSGAVYYFNRENPRASKSYGKTGSVPPQTEDGLALRWGRRTDSSAEYASLVYGEQGKWEDLLSCPIYGTFRKDSALAGIILGGDYDTEIVVRRDYGSERLSSVSPRFCYRYFWNSKRDTESRKLRLAFLRDRETTYAGLANLYRNYLLNEKKVPTLNERSCRNPAISYFRDSLYFRILFGMTHDKVAKCYQIFDEVAETIPDFQAAGFKQVSFIGTGANLGGHDWAHPTIFPFETNYGGGEGMERMLKAINGAGYTFGLHANYKDVYRHSPDWNEETVQCDHLGQLRFHGAWMGGYSYQGIPHKMLEQYVKRDFPRLRAMGMRGFFYLDAIGAVMEESFPPSEPICRREYGEGMNAYMAEAEKEFGCCGNEVCISDSLGILTHSNIFYSGGPVSTDVNGYARNGMLDHFVPVQNMVFHGLCLYSGGPEVGGMTGGGSDKRATPQQIQEFRAKWEEAQEWGGPLHYEFFTNHEELAPGVMRSEFSDGTVIFVNRNEHEWIDGNHRIPGKYHKIIRR